MLSKRWFCLLNPCLFVGCCAWSGAKRRICNDGPNLFFELGLQCPNLTHLAIWLPGANLMGNDRERFDRSGIISCVELASRVPGFVQVLLNPKTFRVQWQLCQDLKGLRTTNSKSLQRILSLSAPKPGHLPNKQEQHRRNRKKTWGLPWLFKTASVTMQAATNAPAQFQMAQWWSHGLRCTWWREQRWGAVPSLSQTHANYTKEVTKRNCM